MKYIVSKRGEKAKVDDSWYDQLAKYSWHVSKDGYMYRSSQKNNIRFTQSMHRLVAGSNNGDITDHINGDKLDNRSENLRICTFTENMRNRPKYTNNKSGHKGVVRVRDIWRAKITVNKVKIHLGYYKTAHEASIAYQKASNKYFGDFSNVS